MMPPPGLTTVTGMLLATVDAAEAAACGDQASAACLLVYRATHNDVVARTADWLIARPLKIVLVLVLALIVGRILQRAVDRFVAGVRRTGVLRAQQRATTLGAVLRSVGRVVVWTIAGLTILSEFDVDLGPVLAGAGIAGVAIGFGAQTLVKDFLSGVFMLAEDQYGVGDVIDAGPAIGVVEDVSLRITRLRDADGVIWHIPNGTITRIGNRSQATTPPPTDPA
jgi:small-conductance mechanosensitive channel